MPRSTIPWLYSQLGSLVAMPAGLGQRVSTASAKRRASDIAGRDGEGEPAAPVPPLPAAGVEPAAPLLPAASTPALAPPLPAAGAPAPETGAPAPETDAPAAELPAP